MNALSNGGCAARFAAEKILPRESDPFAPNRIGDIAHAVLEDLYGLDAELRTPEAAMDLAMRRVAEVDLGLDESTTDTELAIRRSLLLTDVHNAYRGIFDIEQPSKIEPLHLEMRLNDVEIDGIPLTGFVDRLDPGSVEDTVRVIDYKSGKFRSASPKFGDSYGDQLRIYALGVSAATGKEVESASLLFTKEARARKVAMSKPYIRDTKRRFVTAWETLNDSCDSATFATSVTGLCGYCPLVNACPAAGEAGKTSQIDAPHPVSLGLDIPVRAADPEPVPEPPEAPDAAEAIPEGEASAHPQCENATAMTGETMTTAHAAPWPEDKPWEETIRGRLNPNSYSAQAVIGVTTFAMRKLHAAGEPVRPSSIRAVVSALSAVLNGAMQRLGGYDEIDWDAGLNTRVRGAMFSVIDDLHPIPFTTGKGRSAKRSSAADWEAWIERVTSNLVALMQISEQLFDGGITDAEYLSLAADYTPAATEDTEDGEDDDAEGGNDNTAPPADKTTADDSAAALEPEFDDSDDCDDMIDGF